MKGYAYSAFSSSGRAPFLNLRLVKLLGDIEGDHDDDRHDERDRASEIPVARSQELGLDNISDEHVLAAAEELRNTEARYRGQEYQRDAADNAGKRKRERNLRKAAQTVRAEVLCRLDQAVIHLRERSIYLQDHKGNEVIDHSQYYRKFRVHHRDGSDTEQPQKLVEDAVVLKDADPRVGTHEHVDPGRECDDQNPLHLQAFTALRDVICRGISEQNADDRCDDRHS